jgi:hypothetical protein
MPMVDTTAPDRSTGRPPSRLERWATRVPFGGPLKFSGAGAFLRRHWTGLLVIAAVALFALDVVATYPGFLTYDPIQQLGQALDTRELNDWHPPVMTVLWSLLLHFPGHPALPMLVVQLVLLWGSLVLLAAYVYRETGRRWISVLPLLLGVLPYVANISGDIWKDDQLAFAILAAVVVLLHVRRGIARTSLRWAALVSVALLLAYAGAVRYNALFAIVPLLLLTPAPTRVRARFRILFAAVVVGGAVAATPAISAIRPVLATHPAGSIMLDDVMHLYSSRELREADVSETLKRSLLSLRRRCPPDALLVNYTWDCPTSNDVTKFFTTQFDYAELRRLYISGIEQHPLRYLEYRTRVYGTFIDPPPGKPTTIWFSGVGTNPFGLTYHPDPLTNALHGYVIESARDVGLLYRPWFWILFGAVQWTGAFRRRQVYGHATVVMAVAASALLYVLGYLPMVIGFDYRFIYWSTIGLSVSGILLLVDVTRRRRHAGGSPDRDDAAAPRRGQPMPVPAAAARSSA